jgi:hypothetical protein
MASEKGVLLLLRTERRKVQGKFTLQSAIKAWGRGGCIEV